MHNSVKVFHLFLHDTVQPHRRLFTRLSVHDGTVHLCSVVKSCPVVILLLRFMYKEVFLFSAYLEHSPAVAHIQPDGTFCSLDQHIMLRPVERRSPLQHRITIVGIFHIYKQHVVLITEILSLMSHISSGHGDSFRHSPHQELHAVQLMNMVVQMSPGFCPDLLPGNAGLSLLPSVPCRMAVQNLSDNSLIDQLFCVMHPMKEIHHMSSHKDYIMLLTGSHHLVTVFIFKRNGLFTKYVHTMLGRLEHRLLM